MLNMTTPRTKENDAKNTAATALYTSLYNNALYCAAVWKSGVFSTKEADRRLGVDAANRLIDDALALCGNPYYKLSATRWGKEARAFLALFQPKPA